MGKREILHTAYGDLEIKVHEGPQSCCAFSESDETLEYYKQENTRLKLKVDILKQRLDDAMLIQKSYREQINLLMSKLNSK